MAYLVVIFFTPPTADFFTSGIHISNLLLWAYVFDPRLITMDKADKPADQVWNENEDELPLAS